MVKTYIAILSLFVILFSSDFEINFDATYEHGNNFYFAIPKASLREATEEPWIEYYWNADSSVDGKYR